MAERVTTSVVGTGRMTWARALVALVLVVCSGGWGAAWGDQRGHDRGRDKAVYGERHRGGRDQRSGGPGGPGVPAICTGTEHATILSGRRDPTHPVREPRPDGTGPAWFTVDDGGGASACGVWERSRDAGAWAYPLTRNSRGPPRMV